VVTRPRGCGVDGTRFLYPVRDDAVGALKSYAEAGAPRPSRGRYDGGEGWFHAVRATVAAVQADDKTPRGRPPWTSAYVDITLAHAHAHGYTSSFRLSDVRCNEITTSGEYDKMKKKIGKNK
jgi:hypothetical protein